VRREPPVLVKRRDQRYRKEPEGDRSGQCKQQRDAYPPVEQRRVLQVVGVGVVLFVMTIIINMGARALVWRFNRA